VLAFFFSSSRRHTRFSRDWSSDVCSSDLGLDWQQRVNWERMREYRIERARQMMKKHGLGALLCMYDENVRYITGTLTPGWNRLKIGRASCRESVCACGGAGAVHANGRTGR